MKKLFLSFMLCAAGLKASEGSSVGNGPKRSPVKVISRDGRRVQAAPMPLSCDVLNNSFSKDLNMSPTESTPDASVRRGSISSSSTSLRSWWPKELENIRSSVERSPEEYDALRKKLDRERQEALYNKLIFSENTTRVNICNGQFVAFTQILNKFKQGIVQKKTDELRVARLQAVQELQRLHNYQMDPTALCPFTGEMFNTRTGETVSE